MQLAPLKNAVRYMMAICGLELVYSNVIMVLFLPLSFILFLSYSFTSFLFGAIFFYFFIFFLFFLRAL